VAKKAVKKQKQESYNPKAFSNMSISEISALIAMRTDKGCLSLRKRIKIIGSSGIIVEK